MLIAWVLLSPAKFFAASATQTFSDCAAPVADELLANVKSTEVVLSAAHVAD